MDLFTSTLSKKEQLRLWIKSKEFARTSEVIRWGSDNFTNRADRYARDLAEEGFLRRLTLEEERFRGFKTKEGIWWYVGK
jgi:hypothetical protein